MEISFSPFNGRGEFSTNLNLVKLLFLLAGTFGNKEMVSFSKMNILFLDPGESLLRWMPLCLNSG